MVAEFVDCVTVSVPAAALEDFEAALGSVCRAVSFFYNEEPDFWDIQGVKERGADESRLAAALAMAELLTGFTPMVGRSLVPAGGWLARTISAFPEQFIGRRFAVRGTHISTQRALGRVTLVLDAGLAFGTGEHHSTRGCLLALEKISKFSRPRRILDLGTGSGILALAAAKVFHRTVYATDTDIRAIRVARRNAKLNGVGKLLHSFPADGWLSPKITRRAQFDLVFANILARPLCAMADHLAIRLAPGGRGILSGLLESQAAWVVSAHRRAGLVLDFRVADGSWTTLVVRRPG